ncbi:MAG: PilZ domain-containing protein [Acidobacteria bacterium]|nr:PilZ domain-containing protein [Acidobacteriota bacterium]MBS1865097.1 PilZ domain-containing protein [Acidobacteriota bacterium]
MAATNDSRRYPRYGSLKGTLLAWQASSSRDVSHVLDLSLGGIYARVAEPPPVGTPIQLLLVAPMLEVRARAVVQRSEPKRGMGIKLIAMHQDDRARFASWLNRLP